MIIFTKKNENSITSDNYITLDLCNSTEMKKILPENNYLVFCSQFLDT